MKLSCTVLLSTAVLLFSQICLAASPDPQHELRTLETEVDIVGDVEKPEPSLAAADTIWIADWTFDAQFGCTDAGWIKTDNRILSDGIHHWNVNDEFSGVGDIVGQAAQLGDTNLCWVFPRSYDNNWNTALRFDYEGGGPTFLSFKYLVDSEPGFDFLQVECDSACASFDRVDYDTDPTEPAAAFRDLLFSVSGFDTVTAQVDSLSLSDYGPGTHCGRISFISDGAFSPADGLHPTFIEYAAVIDQIIVEGHTNFSEDFEGSPPYAVEFENIQDREPFGLWARVYPHATDNDACTENRTCSWIFTDDTTPTIANHPSMAFGPGQFVVRNWLDNMIHSPWVSLASTPGAVGTVLSFRNFAGNSFATSRIVQNWSVRGKSMIANSETPSPGDSIVCLSSWGHAFRWNSLNLFRWVTGIVDMESYFEPTAREIQVRFRQSDWQWIAGHPLGVPFIPGPGPYLDRIRIGRRFISGPVIVEGLDSRTQAQDAFATELAAWAPGTKPWIPSQDRFGSCAFSNGREFGRASDNFITGDSITVSVKDVRGAGGITSVNFYGMIVSGPHTGTSPPPWSLGTNFFFRVPADSVRNTSGQVVENAWFVSLDDEYFRGGDVLRYFWAATDAQGGFTSDPLGMDTLPTSLSEAEAETGGLLEVNFLPTINWDVEYLDRIWADPHGKLEPTADELANSEQKNCILYYQGINTRRLSGDLNRTSLMHSLDELYYADLYDVYDHQGLGNTNNHLGGRASVAQATGYSLIIYDAGNRNPGAILPNGSDNDALKVDQAIWFRDYLAQGAISEAGIANLWILGSNAVEELPNNSLYADMGVVFVGGNQALNNNPDVEGQTSITFSNATVVNFAGDRFSVQGGCPSIRNYDALDASGTAVNTHRWKDPASATLGDAAIVMNANPAEKWNTVMQALPFFDIRDTETGPTSPEPEDILLIRILSGTLPLGCESGRPSDAPGVPSLDGPPARTALFQNTPNPFNPTTTIRFDLARDGGVELTIYDVAGRAIRTLINESMLAGRRTTTWNGLDDAGRQVASGVYFYRLESEDLVATRKLVVLQ